jgi:hypothetical protein
VCALVLCGCARFFPSDPEPKLIGFRWEGNRLTAFLPICPGNRLESISIRDDANLDKVDEAPPIWTASEPNTPDSRDGKVSFDDSAQFDTTSGPLTAVPADLDVSYRMTRGWGSAVRVPLTDIPHGDFGPDKYWTPKGVKTRAQLVAQFSCSKPTSD